MEDGKTIRLAAISDLHYDKHSAGALVELFRDASENADILLLCGDLTDYGIRAEAEILAADLSRHVDIPMLGVLGNHDFESGTPEEVWDTMEEIGVTMLDGGCTEVAGIGFAGVSGFGGGFGEYMLNAWGERLIKEFVQGSVDEALKLERALTKLDTKPRVVMMHYSPIRATVEGEPAEIMPFLGSSRLEEPLNRFHVAAVFHGHAHKGQPEGETSGGIRVYNVSIPVLRHSFPDQVPVRYYDIALDGAP